MNHFAGNIGISGCKIVFKDNEVIKSCQKTYSPRLQKQIQKQYYFSRNFSCPRTPYIHKVTPNSFEMDRVSGVSWLDYFKFSGQSKISSFFDNLLEYLNNLKQNSTPYDSQELHKSIIDKLNNLARNSNYKSFIAHLNHLTCLNTLRQTPCPRSFCHGDLTLSNILFSIN